MKIFRSIAAAIAALALASCSLADVGRLMGAGSGPPAGVQRAAQIARGPIDFALHAFDAGLYAFDLAMDLRRPAAGTPEARRIAALGRRVLAALAVADAAQRAGSASTYDEAFANANQALSQFRVALGVPAGDAAALDFRASSPRLAMAFADYTPAERDAILARAVAQGTGPARGR